ncbi:hypothetical protein AYO49_03240 [Verrucomicrobiaceae bacterium SCGC AG-212-N21]|nr:hypothetical protein AYO49_03240 [Verrucomicrobiaceae bacterium SCGC AG-212-N21]
MVWTLTACLLPVLYVASVGPVGGLFRNGFIGFNPSRPWVFQIYYPVGWLAEATSMEEPLQRYISWWEEVLPLNGPRD